MLADLARAVLSSADSASMLALAEATVGDVEIARLALEVLNPEASHRARRAIQLAERILTVVAADARGGVA